MALTSGLIYLYNPIKSLVYEQKLVSLLPIEIVFVDQSSLTGFLIANSLMVVMGLYAVFESLFMGLHFVAAIFNYSIQVEIIECDVKQLDEFWSNSSISTKAERYFLLRNICQKCQDKNK